MWLEMLESLGGKLRPPGRPFEDPINNIPVDTVVFHRSTFIGALDIGKTTSTNIHSIQIAGG
jgi:hypothetical protein